MVDRVEWGETSFNDRETFAVDLLTHLSDVMQDTLGAEDTELFLAAVADRMARHVTRDMRELGEDGEDSRMMAELLVRLKRQIGGQFTVERHTDDLVVFRGCRCPFGDLVKGRPSLCQMTAGVFGRVVADTLGYARVSIVESIARGNPTCKVVVDLQRAKADGIPSHSATTEYFRSPPISTKAGGDPV